MLDFPIKHIDGNLVFGHDGTVTAYYQVSGFNYDFLDHDDKFIPFQSQLAFLFNNRYDLHYIAEPFPTNIEEIINSSIEEMKLKTYELKQNGLQYMEMLRKALVEQRNMMETSEYREYIGVQLLPELNKYKDTNAGLSVFNSMKEFARGLNSQIHRAVGINANDILESEIEIWKEQADTILESVQSAFNCNIKTASTAETVYLIEKEFSVTQSNIDIEQRRDFSTSEAVVGIDEEGEAQKAIRPVEQSFIEIQNTNIDEVTPTSLKFSKVIENDEVKNLHVKYLVAHTMDTENYFPNFEWIYFIQSKLSFPVSISVRAYHQSNERITKKLSNKRLEFKDQRKEALKAGVSTDLSLDQSESGAIQAENYFKKTGQPAYSCSFVFKVTGESEKELNTRAKRLKDEMIKYGIKIVAPYGEQLNLLMEKILGSRQINQDYKIEVDSGVLAGMMFGATTNIGDNRGFFVGYTERLKRPVFIQPDLAAKAFDGLGNIEDSISALVAGATGKGKSFFMNLYTYLSLLTGSQALIIDPKGDRKDWDSLPLIPKDYISKWTLGMTKDDAGCLDPFRTSVDVEEGKSVTVDILSYLTDVKISDVGYSIISEAVEETGRMDDPCIGAVISLLEAQYEKGSDVMTPTRFAALESLVNTLRSLKRQKLSDLLFGEVDQNYKVLKVDKPLQILMVENLSLPDGKSVTLRPSQKISEAILISITAFTKQYMFKQERTRHKIVLQDEASTIDNSPIGRELMDFIVRKGRFYNTTLLKGSQNATDHGDDVPNMGMKFSFGLRTTKEAKEMLEFLNLPQTRGNIDRIRSMSKGKCLFQDIYGRTAVINIDPVFSDLAKAFDSSTSTEEERERERQRQFGGNYDPEPTNQTA
ncbi:hypothetical protein CWS20_22850 [Cytobacillus horneckiae]|uniref:ATP-binding protein n=1 Tax=Cytobacillus horneckiae TaxID=549687 RepID=A0A2N0ZB04_9BACI|nr:ATP-binding protein [Bacillus sp. CRN 9]PKG26701.1 hypothetical protein CWS20_22850 [Cytobacillus horneckiae]